MNSLNLIKKENNYYAVLENYSNNKINDFYTLQVVKDLLKIKLKAENNYTGEIYIHCIEKDKRFYVYFITYMTYIPKSSVDLTISFSTYLECNLIDELVNIKKQRSEIDNFIIKKEELKIKKVNKI